MLSTRILFFASCACEFCPRLLRVGRYGRKGIRLFDFLHGDTKPVLESSALSDIDDETPREATDPVGLGRDDGDGARRRRASEMRVAAAGLTRVGGKF
jgi:hypothetical protein